MSVRAPPDDVFAKVLGGVAFVPSTPPSSGPALSTFDILAADCVDEHTTLHRFELNYPTPDHGTPTLHHVATVTPGDGAEGGCGLTNHPSGFIFSNSTAGIWKLDTNGHAVVPGPGDPPNPMAADFPGNALGITTDPRAPAISSMRVRTVTYGLS